MSINRENNCVNKNYSYEEENMKENLGKSTLMHNR